MRVAAVGSLTLALIGFAGRAWADEKQACVSAAESAQRQRSSGKLREARASLLMCSRPVCPAIVRADCTGWLADNEASLPTLVLRAEDEHGRELSDVRVELDGELVASRLDGVPIASDAGEHWLAFERSGGPVVRVRIVVETGEKNRVITVKLAEEPPPKVPAAAPVVQKAPPPEAPRPAARSNAPAWALAGVAAGAVASFTYFGLSERAAVNRLRAS